MGGGVIKAAAVQIAVSMDVSRNLAALELLLEPLEPGVLAVAPEGALSGYLPDRGFEADIDLAATDRAIDRMRTFVESKRIHLIAGACILEDGRWRNSSFYFGPGGATARYDKINLAQIERGAFTPGDALPVFDIVVDDQPVKLGIQMCREIRYLEQWRTLAVKGAQIIAYVNNAVGSARGDALWRAHMISRAAEIQRFVIGANNAAADQTCPTMIVSPAGEVISEARNGVKEAAIAALELSQTSDWILAQAREDVVRVGPPEAPRPLGGVAAARGDALWGALPFRE
jgi:predicted amidohydrolase